MEIIDRDKRLLALEKQISVRLDSTLHEVPIVYSTYSVALFLGKKNVIHKKIKFVLLQLINI